MKQLFDAYKAVQKVRMGLEQQLLAISRAGDDGQLINLRNKILQQVKKTERTLLAYMKTSLKYEPIWSEWLEKVEGIGVTMGSALISYLTPIERFSSISKLWRYSGYACIEGRAEKPVRGKKIKYNPKLKTLLWLLGESFVKTKGYYRGLYEKVREDYNGKWRTPDDCGSNLCRSLGRCTDRHKYEASKRKVIKIFLAHYFAVARDLAGLPNQKPYVIEFINGHEHYIEPPYYHLKQKFIEKESIL